MQFSFCFHDAISTCTYVVHTRNIAELNCLFARDNSFSRSNLKIEIENVDVYNETVIFNLDYECQVIAVKLFARW